MHVIFVIAFAHVGVFQHEKITKQHIFLLSGVGGIEKPLIF